MLISIPSIFTVSELSDPSSIEYSAEELRIHALAAAVSSTHSSPSSSLVHSPELSRRGGSGSGTDQHFSPRNSRAKNTLDSKTQKSPGSRFFTSPSKDASGEGQIGKDKKFSHFSSPFTRRKADSQKQQDKESSSVASPFTFRKGSDTGSTSSGGVQSPGSRSVSRTQSPAGCEFVYVQSQHRGGHHHHQHYQQQQQQYPFSGAELYGGSRGTVSTGPGTASEVTLERGACSSPTLSRCLSSEPQHSSPRRSSETTAYAAAHHHRSVTFSSFKRSPSHEPQLRKTQEPPYRIHRAITQPISENYDYAYVYQIDRTIGTTTAIIECRPSDEPPRRSRSTGTDIHPPVPSIESIIAASSSSQQPSSSATVDDSRSPKRHTPPSSTPPQAQSPKRRQFQSDQSKTRTQIVIEDRSTPPVIDSACSAQSSSSSAKREGSVKGQSDTLETSPTGTLDSVDLKESKFGSSSTMSVGSEASPTTERNRARKTVADKVTHFSVSIIDLLEF